MAPRTGEFAGGYSSPLGASRITGRIVLAGKLRALTGYVFFNSKGGMVGYKFLRGPRAKHENGFGGRPESTEYPHL